MNILRRHWLVLPVQLLHIPSFPSTSILSFVAWVVLTTTGSWEALDITSDTETLPKTFT